METRPRCKTHTITTRFHGNSEDMTKMPCLIMQYKPYIVEHSSTGLSVRKLHHCTCGKTTDTHEQFNGNMFISIYTHIVKQSTEVHNASNVL